MLIDENIKILIIEDSNVFTGILTLILEDIGLRNVWCASSYDHALKLFDDVAPDLLLIDIDLGESRKSGIDLAKKIRELSEEIPIIYLTSHYNEAFYERCRPTRPSGFLSKDISQFKVKQAIDMALQSTLSTSEEVIPQKQPATAVASHLFFRIGDNFKSIPLSTIVYFYADHRLSYAKVAQRNFPTSIKLKTLEKMLFPNFLRIHKAYLVNTSMIESIDPKEKTLIINGETLPIGDVFKKTFFTQLYLLK